MADKKVEKNVEDAPQSASIASGSTKSKAVCLSWTTTTPKQDVIREGQDLLNTLKAADPADMD